MQERFSKQYFDFIPETFVLPEQWNSFCKYFNQQEDVIKNQVLMSNGQVQSTGLRPLRFNYWICKPTSSSQGKGIYIVNNLRDVVKNQVCVISRYLDNPLLLNGHKFDLRIYVVITSFDPLRVYVYREGLVRFASQKYQNVDLSSADAKYTHLTNYSINKNNEAFV